jgi:hypothetical protein
MLIVLEAASKLKEFKDNWLCRVWSEGVTDAGGVGEKVTVAVI